jgi:hypothetical protein
VSLWQDHALEFAFVDASITKLRAPWPMERFFARRALVRLPDRLAMGVAFSLPWSTTATGLLVVLWLISLVPTLKPADLWREIMTPAGGLPVALWLFAGCAMLWAEAPLVERFAAFTSFFKLLVVPLLLAQFRRSPAGLSVAAAFLFSCTLLLAASWFVILFPELYWRPSPRGVPVKDYIVQSGEFLLCAYAGAHVALNYWREGARYISVAVAALALAFLTNIVFVETGRTTLTVFPVLVVLFAIQRFSWRGAATVIVCASVLAAVSWASSPHLQSRVLSAVDEVRTYWTQNAVSPAGLRLEFWIKSFRFIGDAPIIGHGTGAVEDLFGNAAKDKVGAAGAPTDNPHNQTLLIAVQMGALGVAMLWAMWAAHLLLFRGSGLVAWLGTGLVLHYVIASSFNSSISDFTTGWTYVFGVGVLGGTMLGNPTSANAKTPGN